MRRFAGARREALAAVPLVRETTAMRDHTEYAVGRNATREPVVTEAIGFKRRIVRGTV